MNVQYNTSSQGSQTSAERFLETIASFALSNLPIGISPEYFQSFMARNRVALLQMIQSQLGALLEARSSTPSVSARALPEPALPTGAGMNVGVELREIGNRIGNLANETRGSKRADEERETLGRSGAAGWNVPDRSNEDDEPHGDDDTQELDEGDAPGSESSASSDKISIQNTPLASATGPTSSDAGTASTDHENRSKWGGRSGRILKDEDVVKGTRIVLFTGEHGTVTRHETRQVPNVFYSVGLGFKKIQEGHYTQVDLEVTLDNGRKTSPSTLFEEIEPPRRVIADVMIDGAMSNSVSVPPDEAWTRVAGAHAAISDYMSRAERARKSSQRQAWVIQSNEARLRFQKLFSIFENWRAKFPEYQVDALDDLKYRIMLLESSDQRRLDRAAELRWLNETPTDWRTRYQPGDQVMTPQFVSGADKSPELIRDTIKAIQGHQAQLVSDTRRPVPLFMLRHAPQQTYEIPTYAESKWLADVGNDMVAGSGRNEKGYMERGAAAVAVKGYLEHHGIPVHSRVETGSMMNGVRLSPPNGRDWSNAEMNKMNGLLPGLDASRTEARYHPTHREGTPGDPYTDYYGTPSGILLNPEQIRAFAPLLAKAMKDAGQTLNRKGEAWLSLRKSAPRDSDSAEYEGTTTRESTRESTRKYGGVAGGATADQRESASGGCENLSFEVPGHGTVRVVCGQKGRRDTWHNVWVRGVRYGYNGGRWARNNIPATTVLEAIQQRGITAFG